MKPTNSSLFTTLFSDGLFHLIGPVYEEKLHQLNIKGFVHYYEAEDARIRFNYLKFII